MSRFHQFTAANVSSTDKLEVPLFSSGLQTEQNRAIPALTRAVWYLRSQVGKENVKESERVGKSDCPSPTSLLH